MCSSWAQHLHFCCCFPGCRRTKLCARGQGRAVAGTRGRGVPLLHSTASSGSGTFKGTTAKQVVQAPPLPSPPLAAALRCRLTPNVGLGLLGHTSLRVEARHRGSGGGVRVLQLSRAIASSCVFEYTGAWRAADRTLLCRIIVQSVLPRVRHSCPCTLTPYPLVSLEQQLTMLQGMMDDLNTN